MNAPIDLTSLSWKQYNADLSGSALPEPTCWSVAVEYFRLFRNGFRESVPSSNNTEMIDSNTQIDFLRAVMASDVVYDSVVGVRALVRNWQRVTATHPDIDIRLVRLEKGSEASVVAIVKGLTTISENTVKYAFPHLVEGNYFSPLAQRLLGRQLEVDGVLQMTWDDKLGRVVNLQFQASMMTAMFRILGSLEDVASVFESAYMDPECRALAH
ncbi:hypothetical protein PHMEG_00019876 [Phytophthora megakarya]|uniref:Bzip transcription factor n=1 Tax=Phytophthora megakarya TaxID=4795 RepID=A0A225VQ85_9STRA|nr:hypothetical protein PHMEG_00019876 [Phytophthora megakarya]